MSYGTHAPRHSHAGWIHDRMTRRMVSQWVEAILPEFVAGIAAGYGLYAVLAAVSPLHWVPRSPLDAGVLATLVLLVEAPYLAAQIRSGPPEAERDAR